MITFKKTLKPVFVLTLLMLSYFNLKAQDAAGMKKITGTFVQIDMGDYKHLIIDSNGESIDFFVFKDDENFRTLETHPDKYEGKPITIFYKRGKVHLEEAGGDVEVNQYLGCELGN